MGKIVILGDIHGRLIWNDIIEKENPDKVIFLGDYVSTHELIPADQQLSNLEDILNYKEANPDKVILLRGNHCMQHLGYSWAECSGWDQDVYEGMKPMKDRFLKLTQWVYQIPDTNIVCSHAGISTKFLDACTGYFDDSMYSDKSTDLEIINLINTIEPCELFGFTPCKMSDYCGESATQPCTWIRPYTLLHYGVKGIIHVVGHTPVKNICNIKEESLKLRDKYGITESEDIVKDYCDIWCCDNLQNKEYLVIEDGKFIPKIHE